MVSCCVADELQTALIACNIAGVMGSHSGLEPLLNMWALGTPTCILLEISACRHGLVMACTSRFDSTCGLTDNL